MNAPLMQFKFFFIRKERSKTISRLIWPTTDFRPFSKRPNTTSIPAIPTSRKPNRCKLSSKKNRGDGEIPNLADPVTLTNRLRRKLKHAARIYRLTNPLQVWINWFMLSRPNRTEWKIKTKNNDFIEILSKKMKIF